MALGTVKKAIGQFSRGKGRGVRHGSKFTGCLSKKNDNKKKN